MVYDNEVEKAKQAALDFLEGTLGDPAFPEISQEAIPLYYELIKFGDLQPIMNGRIHPESGPIDLLSKSFWHTCCYLLAFWFQTRYLEGNEFVNNNVGHSRIMVYRGQANPWIIKPTAWRAHNVFQELREKIFSVYKNFIGNKLPEDDIVFNNFSQLNSEAGIEALAQHHGFPTSLVDFSFNPLIGLLFSNSTSPEDPGLANSPVSGHAVIYQTYYSNLAFATIDDKLMNSIPLLPPAQMARIYQQSGFFIGFGEESSLYESRSSGGLATSALEECFTRIFYPRSYPEPTIGRELTQDNLILKYIYNQHSPLESAPIRHLKTEWYTYHPFFTKSLEILKTYCETKTHAFDEEEILDLLESADLPPAPWATTGTRFHSPLAADLLALEALEISNNHLRNAAFKLTSRGYGLDPLIIGLYNIQNPGYFRLLKELQSRNDNPYIRSMHHHVQNAINEFESLVR